MPDITETLSREEIYELGVSIGQSPQLASVLKVIRAGRAFASDRLSRMGKDLSASPDAIARVAFGLSVYDDILKDLQKSRDLAAEILKSNEEE